MAEAAVGTQDDAHARPGSANLCNDASHLLHRAVAAGDVRAPLPGQQQMPAAEHIKRQIAVLLVMAVVEAAFLHAVQRDVGVVEIEHDLARRTLVRLEEKIDQQRIDLRGVAIDLVVLRAVALRRMLQTIERALARKCLAVRAQHRGQLPSQRRKRWVLPQLVVIIEILITKCQGEDPLANQRLNPMLNITRVTPVAETPGEPTDQPQTAINLAQQQPTRVRSDIAAVEPGHHRTPINRFKFKQLRATVCLHRGTPLDPVKSCSQNHFARFAAPMHHLGLRNPG